MGLNGSYINYAFPWTTILLEVLIIQPPHSLAVVDYDFPPTALNLAVASNSSSQARFLRFTTVPASSSVQ